jgi:RNase P subunit RPR2
MDSLTRMQFLWTAAHEVLEINPALSSFYLSQIQSDKNVNISKSLIKRFCTHCSTLFIPGVTCQVEIKTVKKKEK